VKGQDPKLPGFFSNKQWDLGSLTTNNTGTTKPEMPVRGADIPVCKPRDLPKPDPSVINKRQRRCSFHLQPSARFGMVLDETPEPLPCGLLVVTNLDASSAFARTSGGGCGLMVGDVIVEVNGRGGCAAELRDALLHAFSAVGQKVVDVLVRARPPAFNIELRREGKHWKNLGISAIADPANPACLLVEGVHGEGLVPLWNSAHGSLRICKGDLITHVNGVSQDVAAMKREGSSRGSKLVFRIVTPPGQIAGCQKEQPEDPDDMPWPEATVPWDMQVRWLDDCTSEVSTAYHSSIPSGTRTPEEVF